MKYTYRVWHDSSVYQNCVMFSVSHGGREVVKDRRVDVPLIDILVSSNTTIKRCLKRGKTQAEDLIKILKQHEILGGGK